MPSQTRRVVPPRVRAALRAAAPALLAYALVRAVGLAVLTVWAGAQGRDAYNLLTDRWDAVWYRRVAEGGYGFELRLPDGEVHSNLAFFPLFPWLERLVVAISPLDFLAAGIAISWPASLAAAWGIYAVGVRVASLWDLPEATGRRIGVLLAVLWGVLPMAYVESMAYTESLFTALCAWALHAVLSGRWILAGVLTALAGLTRPSAVALIAAVGLAGLVHLWRERRWDPRVLGGLVLAPLGWLSYVVWVGVRTGSPFGYFEVQAQWGNGFDGGRALFLYIWSRLFTTPQVSLAILLGLGLVVYLLVLCVRQKQPLPLLVFTFGIVALSLVGASYFSSRPRLMLPAFPLLLPIAAALVGLRVRTIAIVLGSVALASGVYGAVMLLSSGPP